MRDAFEDDYSPNPFFWADMCKARSPTREHGEWHIVGKWATNAILDNEKIAARFVLERRRFLFAAPSERKCLSRDNPS